MSNTIKSSIAAVAAFSLVAGMASATETREYPDGFNVDLCVGEVVNLDEPALDQVARLIMMGVDTGAFMVIGNSDVNLSHSVPYFGWPDIYRMHVEGHTCMISEKTFEDFGAKVLLDINPETF